jgi:hypothetical protein
VPAGRIGLISSGYFCQVGLFADSGVANTGCKASIEQRKLSRMR